MVQYDAQLQPLWTWCDALATVVAGRQINVYGRIEGDPTGCYGRRTPEGAEADLCKYGPTLKEGSLPAHSTSQTSTSKRSHEKQLSAHEKSCSQLNSSKPGSCCWKLDWWQNCL